MEYNITPTTPNTLTNKKTNLGFYRGQVYILMNQLPVGISAGILPIIIWMQRDYLKT